MSINKFINFKGLFLYLIEDLKTDRSYYLPGHLGIFISTDGPEKYDLEIDDCEITDKYIHFTFGKYLEIAHEGSSGYVASCNYFITYDREKERFISCDYEQG